MCCGTVWNPPAHLRKSVAVLLPNSWFLVLRPQSADADLCRCRCGLRPGTCLHLIVLQARQVAWGQLWVPLALSKATGRKEGGGAGLVKLINLWRERKGWPGQPGLGPGGSKGQVLSPCLEKEVQVESEQKGKADSSKLNGKASTDYT